MYTLEFEVVDDEFVIDGSREDATDVVNRVEWELDNLPSGEYCLLILPYDVYMEAKI